MQTAPAPARAAVRTVELAESTERTPASLRPWLTELGRIPLVRELSEPFAHIPHTATTIVLRAEAGGRREALVLGPRTRATYSVAKAPASCVRLRLAPGAANPMLGVAASELTDRVVRLADLPGPAGELADALGELPHEEILAFLEDELPQRLSENPTQRAHRGLLTEAAAALAEPSGRSIPAVAADLAVSERQLRNLFSAGIGLSPKHFARIGRVRQILAYAGDTPWSRIAADNGYYDQSHLTADFRTLMGVPPAKFFRGHLPAPTPCQAPA
ncbi:AraC family transcriptional regulator [Nocardia bhagyanarayanae]|uniref:AraC family transcriptional regulator n=1 Tax=Nocardia bhagyanarayanae TaxID=1215925 RepID=UPI001C8ACF14|nr:helix-turn-helix domain-containing protein [Nocardia bhagyanarayanae]